MKIKRIIVASILGLAFLMNYGCGFFVGASVRKADGHTRNKSQVAQSPIKKDTSKLSQTETPPDG